MNSNSLGSNSLNLIFEALVALAAFETVIVQTATSSTKYSTLSLVMLTEISTSGIG